MDGDAFDADSTWVRSKAADYPRSRSTTPRRRMSRRRIAQTASPSSESACESAIRDRRRQRDNPVAGDEGSLQPGGQPIVQSEKAGLKVRSRGERRVPSRKVKWSGREKGKTPIDVAVAPSDVVNSQAAVHTFEASFKPT